MRSNKLTIIDLKRELEEFRIHYPSLNDEDIFSIWFLLAYVTDDEKLYRLARSGVNDYQPNVIFSFANPQESNLLGAMLHERLALPFV